ncbi:MAG: hypothetical protein LBR53_10555 [Deltaproteobacteria bacterium]|jgi:exopolyphosphatase/guanosine-5'-triphosphate,3'-diphosphate pyrophosphatase|nr:hypothetical protein [Deltaproteobacteria bacterium]
MRYPTYAALDLGSNTFRLMLARANEYGLARNTKRVFQETPRLSEGLTPGAPFGRAPLERAWAVLDSFKEIVREAKPRKVLCGATMAARMASDGESFLNDVKKRYGWKTKLLSGSVEAYLTASGVLQGLDEPVPKEAIIFDIGGRSTEFISVRSKNIQKTLSLDMGVVGLTEKHVRSDPPSPEELMEMEKEIRGILNAADFSSFKQDSVLIGTAGTVTTTAAMLLNLKEYSPEAVNDLDIRAVRIRNLFNQVKTQSLSLRKEHPGLPPGRADVIVAGLLLIREIISFFRKRLLRVSDNGLLEGIWLLAAGLIPLDI